MPGRVPEWANWTAATFVGAWVQRMMVAAVQVSNAQCVLSALSRVGVGVAACIILVFASVFLRLLFCGLPFGDGICFCCASVLCFYYLCLLMWVMCVR